MIGTMKNVPALRFPEFTDEWYSSNLGNIAEFSKGKGISKSDITKDGEIECIRYGELYTKYGETINHISSKTNLSLRELVLSEPNDVIIPASGETQLDIATASCVLKSGIALGGDLNIIRSKVNGVFLSYYLNNKKKLEIASLAQGVSVVHLYSSQLKTLNLNLPEDLEQQKIASFLTAVDNKIQQLSKRKSLLEQYKKGLMQQIFSQQIRFKPDRLSDGDDQGNEYPDWEVKTLRDVGEIVGGGTPETYIEKYWGGTIQWFTPTELKKKYVLQSTRQITKDGLANSSAKLLPTGAILLSSRATVGDVSIALGECCTNQGFQSIIANDHNVNEFIYYWLLINKHLLLKKASGSTFLEINKTEISKLKIALPNYSEQTKIANFLSAIDDKINLVSRQLQQSQQYKKGLLQQMFV
ncbi:MAG: restriction endonuclease subunit S [Daejeonella sp.]